MHAQRIAISLVEKGWGGARRLSIRLSRQGVRVRHLVKGRLPAEVVAIIPPYPGMTIRGVPRSWFKLAAWVELWGAMARGGAELVMVDHERAARWVARWAPPLRDKVVVVQEAADGSPRIMWQGASVDPVAFFADGAG